MARQTKVASGRVYCSKDIHGKRLEQPSILFTSLAIVTYLICDGRSRHGKVQGKSCNTQYSTKVSASNSRVHKERIPRDNKLVVSGRVPSYKVFSEFSIFLERHRFAYKRKKSKSNTLFHKVIHNTNPNPFCNRHTYITNTYFVSEYCTLQSNVQLRFNPRT